MIQTERQEIILRPLVRTEIPLLLTYIKKMAKYEKLSDQVTATQAVLENTIFNENAAKVYFLEKHGQIIGFVLYGLLMSTFTGKPTLYLEDIFIDEAERGFGYGKLIFKELAKIAKANDYGRIDWQCLDWNKSSINFYLKLGATPMDDWTMYRLDEEGIINLTK
ncbi:MAG: GNAT family N-acetyltransferase [Erysipelothrix sp.]|nr:GNAT family N-acetyltransferase [Erysipelothrix sp.]